MRIRVCACVSVLVCESVYSVRAYSECVCVCLRMYIVCVRVYSVCVYSVCK